MTPAWIQLLVVVGVLGLLLLRTAPPLARIVGLLAVLGYGIAALDPRRVSFAAVVVPPQQAELALDLPATEVLAAAARSGARAMDLTIRWQQPVAAGLPVGPLGASPTFVGTPLPLQPEDLQARLLRPAAVDRPTALQLEAPGLGTPQPATIAVRLGDREMVRTTVTLDPARPLEVPFTPTAAGEHTVLVHLSCGEHVVERTGTFVVAAAPRVLVLEPSGIFTAALRAQGVAAEAVALLPEGWRDSAALVLGAPLPVEVQQQVEEAVRDGLGVFVLAPAFGVDGEPLRGLLPLRPLPPVAPKDGGSGAGAAEATPAMPREPLPAQPAEPKPPKPPAGPPPAGNTAEAGPVSAEPIEVDKHTIAMVLVVDRSGSMGEKVFGGRTKMDYAKASALQTSRQLMEGDEVGIVTFGNKGLGQVALPLTDATNAPVVRAGIQKLSHARELTFLLSGLELAERLLQPSRAAVKHVVVITDGEFELSESIALRRLAHRMSSEGKSTVSILSIVSGNTGGMFQRDAEIISREGGGVFLAEEDPSRVPVFVSAELARALSRVNRKPRADAEPGTSPVAEPQPAPPKPPEPTPQPEPPREAPRPEAPQRLQVRQVAEAPILEPKPADAWPSLGGATASTARLDGQVMLVAGEQGWPLLAYGNRGLGRVGAFAADLCGEAGAEFRAESAFAARVALWVQHVQRSELRREAAALLQSVTVTPPAPSPRELDQLDALGGMPPVSRTAPPVPTAAAPVRLVVGLGASWALGCLAVLLLLSLCERWQGLRAFQRA